MGLQRRWLHIGLLQSLLVLVLQRLLVLWSLLLALLLLELLSPGIPPHRLGGRRHRTRGLALVLVRLLLRWPCSRAGSVGRRCCSCCRKHIQLFCEQGSCWPQGSSILHSYWRAGPCCWWCCCCGDRCSCGC